MKTITNTHRTSSRACSLWMNITFALLVGSMLPLIVASTSAQTLFFREYAPNVQDASNLSRCIIRTPTVSGVDNYLHVGQYSDVNPVFTAHGIWTNEDGTANAATNYDRTFYNDDLSYTLNFVEDNTVNGSYSATPPYAIYNGHPATGYKVIEHTSYSGQVQLQPATWTTIINHNDRNRKWDHIIYGSGSEYGDISVGKSLVRDNQSTNNFFVLSELGSLMDAGNIRFAVTKYSWVGGNIGHVMTASKEYTLDGYKLYPVGIVQTVDANNNYQLVVVGNAVTDGGGNSRIFAVSINKTTLAVGTVPFRIYKIYPNSSFPTVPWNGNIIANSVTGIFNNDHFLIAGKATINGTSTELPLLFSINQTLGYERMNMYHFSESSNDLNGEFYCAKEYTHDVGNGPEGRVTAVGRVGEIDTYSTSTDAFVMNASHMRPGGGTGTPLWRTRQGTNFSSGNSALTTAKWFVDAPDTTAGSDDRFIYTGEQVDGGITHAISGGVLQFDGSSECYTSPVGNPTEPDLNDDDPRTLIPTNWGEDVSDPTYKYSPELSPKKCNGGTISAGKRSNIDDPKTGFPIKDIENASITIVNDALNIMYSSTEDASLKLVVVDLMGNTLVNQRVSCSAGTHYYTIDTKEWVTGPYYVSVIGARSNINKNIVIIK